MHIGEKISAAREQLKINHETLAKKLKINKRTMVQIEKASYLSLSAMSRIAKALDVPVELIVNYHEQPGK